MRLLALVLVLAGAQDDPGKAARELIEKFRSGDFETREAATRKLKDLGPGAKAELEKFVKDGDAAVARLAANLIQRFKLQESLPKRLQEALPGVAERLAFGGDPAWTEAFLAVALKCGDSSRLPILTRKEIEPLLSRAVRGADSEADKSAVASAINMRRFRLPSAELLSLLDDPQHGTRPSIIESVNRDPPVEIVRRLIEITRDEDAFRRGRAIEDLGVLGIRSAIPEAERLLGDADKSVRQKAVSALSDLRAKDSVQAILPLLKDPEPVVRRCALETLGNLYARDAIPQIEEVLHDNEIYIREEAVKTLGDLDARASVPKMIPLLKDPDEDVRRAAVYALGELRAREAIPDVKRLLSDPEDMVSTAALSFFDEVDPKQAVALALERMKDPEPFTRGRAAKHLGELGGPEAMAGLIETLKDKDMYVAGQAAIALAKLGDRRGLAILIRAFKTPPYDNNEVMQALADLGEKEIIPKVISKLEDKSRDTRVAAVLSLNILEAKEAAAKIEPLLKDEELLVRWQAVYALAELRGRESIPRLLSLLHDQSPGMVSAALHSLALLKAWEVEAEVARLLEDLKPEVRYFAASWLARAGSTKGVPELLDQDVGPFTALNALREPDVWKRLNGTAAPVDLQGTRRQKIEKVAQAAGMKLLEEPAPLGDSQRSLGRENGRDEYYHRGESVTESLWGLVPRTYALVIEKDRIRLMTLEAGERFWRAWWKDYQASKK